MGARTALVTGGFGALGRVVGAAFQAAGYDVALVDKADPPSGLGSDILAMGGIDLTRAAGAEQAMARVGERFGRLDVLANVAGGFRWETHADGSADTWDLMYALNVKTCANMCRAAIPALTASGGRIVNVGAEAAVRAAAGMAPYAASKAGVHRLTEALAEELKGKVAVNAVLPTILDTPQNRADMPDADPSIWVAPQKLAEVILFLASDQASAMTGALVSVRGRV